MALAKLINRELALFPEWAVKCGLGPMLPVSRRRDRRSWTIPTRYFFRKAWKKGKPKKK
jgi:hypothetical protein